MTERLIGPTGGRRRKRLALFVPLLAIAALILAIGASAGSVGTASGFQDDDGNLIADGAGIDWNTFDSGTNGWVGTAPYKTRDEVVSGWKFKGLADAEAVTTDSAFAGGTKQDDNCATVNTGKAPNKDDLKRAYISSKIVDGDVFLNLAWVRIPQNTTSPSAHIGFEFNQGETACATGGLVSRVEDDLLFVYDFEGGTTEEPTITLRRWILTGACEVANQTAPCWGPATNLTALGYAEAKVNTLATALDELPPTNETLGLNEFGEAGINLSDAGVFTPGECDSFGTVFAVSRSSGNSGTAQMKDIAGPGDFELTNCGSIIIRKVTSPSPDSFDTAFDYTTTGGLTPSTFDLKNGENQDYGSEVQAGSYTVSETPNANYTLSNIDCSASTVSGGSDIDIGVDADGDFTAGDTTISIVLAAEDSIDCTYTNTLKVGALIINKKSTKTGNPFVANAGAIFAVDGPDAGTTADFSVTDDLTAAAPDEDADAGQVCVSGLLTGTYTINETTPPSGYGGASQTDLTATVVAGTNCGANLPAAGATVTFTNAPLYDLQVNFNDDGSGETSATISCSPGDPQDSNDSTTAPSGWDSSKTYNNEVAPASITCTIEVDP